ncbi:YgaP family membrane protein [Nocardioides caricicola]
MSGDHVMNLDRAVLAVAGGMVLLSVLLTVVFSPWWLLLTAFVGLNLLQSSVTGFCPAAIVLRRLGVAEGCAFR